MLIKFPLVEHKGVSAAIINLSGIMRHTPDGYMFYNSGSSSVVLRNGSEYQPDDSIRMLKDEELGSDDESDDEDEEYGCRIPLVIFENNFTNNLNQAKIKSAEWVLSGNARLCVLSDIAITPAGKYKTLTIYMFRHWHEHILEDRMEPDEKEGVVYQDKSSNQYYMYRSYESKIFKLHSKPVVFNARIIYLYLLSAVLT